MQGRVDFDCQMYTSHLSLFPPFFRKLEKVLVTKDLIFERINVAAGWEKMERELPMRHWSNLSFFDVSQTLVADDAINNRLIAIVARYIRGRVKSELSKRNISMTKL